MKNYQYKSTSTQGEGVHPVVKKEERIKNWIPDQRNKKQIHKRKIAKLARKARKINTK